MASFTAVISTRCLSKKRSVELVQDNTRKGADVCCKYSMVSSSCSWASFNLCRWTSSWSSLDSKVNSIRRQVTLVLVLDVS